MFGRRKLRNTAAAALPPIERNTTINNQAPNYVGLVFVLFGVVIIMPVFGWLALVFIMDRLGYSRPDEAAAEFVAIFFIAAIGIGLVVLFFHSILNKVFDHLERMKTLDLDMLDRQARIAVLPPETSVSMTNEAKLKARLIRAVVYNALFNGYTDADGLLYGKVQPWSRRSVSQMKIAGETPTEAVAGSVARWLTEKNFLLTDRQLNLKRFGNSPEDFLQAVTEEIYRDFGRPINFNVNDDIAINGYVAVDGVG